MPARWFNHTRPDGDVERVLFEDAPEFFEGRGIMPAFAVKAILKELVDKKPSFHVRPSDVSPTMNCRRQRVWETTHDYGVDAQGQEPALLGGFIHEAFDAMEIDVPAKVHIEHPVEGSTIDVTPRVEVCGVPMKGKIDWLEDGVITDLKTTTPYYYAQYPPKGSGGRPFVVLWEPPPEEDIAKWVLQLSCYAVMLGKIGAPVPLMGRIWRRYEGVKPDEHKRWSRFDFPLLTESELERKVGPWIRELQAALTLAESGDLEAWRTVPADGLNIVSKRGKKWACQRCPLQVQCSAVEGVDVW